MEKEPVFKDDVKADAAQEVGASGNDEHLITLNELEERYRTSFNANEPAKSFGLTFEDSLDRLNRDGRNLLTPPKQKPELVKFLQGFTNFFMVLLMAAGVLSIVAYGLDTSTDLNLYLGIVLFVIVIITVAIGYFQNRKADGIMKVFSAGLCFR
jgi:sodium/potassium-transporting ATPase subunit alpha